MRREKLSPGCIRKIKLYTKITFCGRAKNDRAVDGLSVPAAGCPRAAVFHRSRPAILSVDKLTSGTLTWPTVSGSAVWIRVAVSPRSRPPPLLSHFMRRLGDDREAPGDGAESRPRRSSGICDAVLASRKRTTSITSGRTSIHWVPAVGGIGHATS
ncbi:unnamed protein product [Trichogramma brassicae]|uniref:Uncharacterized protein n=1 Tax=Trichogramma brassicae TaxID=86971 RepID=A0A6H5I292_9HYME|nr:unnamed protein product [Trichogramma brassicae]